MTSAVSKSIVIHEIGGILAAITFNLNQKRQNECSQFALFNAQETAGGSRRLKAVLSLSLM
jgi:hypothetical protein